MLCLVCVCRGLQQILHFETRPRLSTKDFKTLLQQAYYILVYFSSGSKAHTNTHQHTQTKTRSTDDILLPNLCWPSPQAAALLLDTVQKWLGKRGRIYLFLNEDTSEHYSDLLWTSSWIKKEICPSMTWFAWLHNIFLDTIVLWCMFLYPITESHFFAFSIPEKLIGKSNWREYMFNHFLLTQEFDMLLYVFPLTHVICGFYPFQSDVFPLLFSFFKVCKLYNQPSTRGQSEVTL